MTRQVLRYQWSHQSFVLNRPLPQRKLDAKITSKESYGMGMKIRVLLPKMISVLDASSSLMASHFPIYSCMPQFFFSFLLIQWENGQNNWEVLADLLRWCRSNVLYGGRGLCQISILLLFILPEYCVGTSWSINKKDVRVVEREYWKETIPKERRKYAGSLSTKKGYGTSTLQVLEHPSTLFRSISDQR